MARPPESRRTKAVNPPEQEQSVFNAGVVSSEPGEGVHVRPDLLVHEVDVLLDDVVDADIVFADGVANPDDAEGREDQEGVRRGSVDRLGAAQQIVERMGERARDERDRAADGIRVERVGDGQRVVRERGVGPGKFLELPASEQKRDLRQQIHFRSPRFRCVF